MLISRAPFYIFNRAGLSEQQLMMHSGMLCCDVKFWHSGALCFALIAVCVSHTQSICMALLAGSYVLCLAGAELALPSLAGSLASFHPSKCTKKLCRHMTDVSKGLAS